MVRKTIVVLANSFKRNERCVAGRELLLINGRTVLASWIRPVSSHDEGELLPIERTLTSSWIEVGVGDIVEVSLDQPGLDPTQPENWLLFQNGDWSDVSSNHIRPTLDALEEHPQSLWVDPQSTTDRVGHNWLIQNPPIQSLYVVRAEKLAVRLNCDAHGKVTRRAQFEYHGQTYNLSLTDPEAARKLHSSTPKPNAKAVDVAIGDIRICVSLAGSFQGYHYKVVAAILEGL